MSCETVASAVDILLMCIKSSMKNVLLKNQREDIVDLMWDMRVSE